MKRENLSAHVFGIQKNQHFKTIQPRESDSINSSIYEEEPCEFLLKPHTRNYREKKETAADLRDKIDGKSACRGKRICRQARKQTKEIVMRLY